MLSLAASIKLAMNYHTPSLFFFSSQNVLNGCLSDKKLICFNASNRLPPFLTVTSDWCLADDFFIFRDHDREFCSACFPGLTIHNVRDT